jgi:hypothetical protein
MVDYTRVDIIPNTSATQSGHSNIQSVMILVSFLPVSLTRVPRFLVLRPLGKLLWATKL